MDHETVGMILQTMIQHWGLSVLIVMAFAVMGGITIAQMIQMKRWQPQTIEIANLLRESCATLKTIAENQSTQHVTCTRHYNLATRQIEELGNVGNELKSVVHAIAESDKVRNAEVLHMMTAIIGRHTP